MYNLIVLRTLSNDNLPFDHAYMGQIAQGLVYLKILFTMFQCCLYGFQYKKYSLTNVCRISGACPFFDHLKFIIV